MKSLAWLLHPRLLSSTAPLCPQLRKSQAHSLRRIKVMMTFKCVCCSLSGRRKENNPRGWPAFFSPLLLLIEENSRGVPAQHCSRNTPAAFSSLGPIWKIRGELSLKETRVDTEVGRESLRRGDHGPMGKEEGDTSSKRPSV